MATPTREERLILQELRKYQELLERHPMVVGQVYTQGLNGLITRVKAVQEEIGRSTEAVAGTLEKTARGWHSPPRGWGGSFPAIGHNWQLAAHDLIGISKGRRCPRQLGEYAPEYSSCFAA